MSVTNKDRGMTALVGRLKNLHALVKVTVGVHGDAGAEANGKSIVEIASYHEFGTATIPARSFIRAWVDGNQGTIQQSLRAAAEGVLLGKYDAKTALEKFGLMAVGGIQRRMSAGIAPPLQRMRPVKTRPKARRTPGKVLPPSPLGKQFGGQTPLIDTGHLRSAITFKVG